MPVGQLRSLPHCLQLQLHLLECMELLVEQLPAGSGLSLPVRNLLLQQLLLPRSILLLQQQQPPTQAVDPEVMQAALDRQRHLAIKVSRSHLADLAHTTADCV